MIHILPCLVWAVAKVFLPPAGAKNQVLLDIDAHKHERPVATDGSLFFYEQGAGLDRAAVNQSVKYVPIQDQQ